MTTATDTTRKATAPATSAPVPKVSPSTGGPTSGVVGIWSLVASSVVVGISVLGAVVGEVCSVSVVVGEVLGGSVTGLHWQEWRVLPRNNAAKSGRTTGRSRMTGFDVQVGFATIKRDDS